MCLSLGDTGVTCAPVGETGAAAVGAPATDDAVPVVGATDVVVVLDIAPLGFPPTGKCSAVTGIVADAPGAFEPEGDT
jgi:hypothetical protein